ncbi:hypothetical protein AMJ80_09815 [bacterium SM23_31]|nr:MAG: hypothetical protein AMJ80_09815 [bacterium SM23_31]
MYKIEIKFITLIRKIQRLFIPNVTTFLLILLCYNSLVFSQEVPIVTYERKVFIDVDYTFNNEVLYKPYQIREIPSTKEKVVLDIGNSCFFVFSDEGKFIRRISQAGQGPGDILHPAYFDVDDEGDIYVYENGNTRISIFTKTGKFINSFRVSKPYKANLFVTKDREILINLPERGYFITVFSREGEVISEVGKISEPRQPLNRSQTLDFLIMSSGWPFKDENNNYYIFLESYYSMRKYNENNDLIKDIKFQKVFPYLKDKKITSDIRVIYTFWDIIFRNNKFYVLSMTDKHSTSGPEVRNLPIFVINNELELDKEIIIPLNKKLTFSSNYRYSYFAKSSYSIEVLSNGDILFPHKDESEIYRFIIRK